MSTPAFVIAAILLSATIGLAAGLIRYYNDRSDFYVRAEEFRINSEKQRVRDCESVLAQFRDTYGYLGEQYIPEYKIAQMIREGAFSYQIGDVLRECLRIPGFVNLGSSHDKPQGVLLSPRLRDRHVYMIGKSGTGKTNLMRHMILQDLASDSGIGVIAPEFEMLRDQLLPHIPEHRIKDVIYFDPTDTSCPVVLNPLHRDQGGNVDVQVDETFTILQRIVGEGGPRMDEILRNSLYALIERPGSTLEDIERLLDRDDHTLRNEVIRTTEQERIRRFFAYTYAQFPKDAHLPITNRIGRFVGAEYVRNCLCPPKDSDISQSDMSKRFLNIRRAMDEGKILLFNLSDGLLGQAASQLIGQFIVSKFQTATMSRANVPENDRRPFYLYLDEFQNFCGTASQSYEKLLSRSRKYRLALILAHQQTHQIPLPLLREVFGNVSTLIAFQVSHPDAVHLAKELGTFPNARWDIDSAFDDQSDPDPIRRLTHLSRGVCFCRMGLETSNIRVPLAASPSIDGIRERVIDHSRNTYGIPRRRGTARGGKATNQEPPSDLLDIDPGNVFE